eukprot:scaffold4736_cov434-Prasinococcus_capsulatus_cf.AAC.8
MVPVGDLLDHCPSAKVDWIRHARPRSPTKVEADRAVTSPEVETLSIVTRKPMHVEEGSKSQEVYITYGAKPNEELLLAYGFCLSDNGDADFHHVQLAFGVDDRKDTDPDPDFEALQMARKVALRHHCGPIVAACAQFQLTLQQPLPPSLLTCAAIGLMPESGLHRYLENANGLAPPCAASRHSIASDLRARLKAAQQLRTLFLNTLARLEGGSAADDENLLRMLREDPPSSSLSGDYVDTRRRVWAVMYRLQQKRIVESAIESLESEIASMVREYLRSQLDPMSLDLLGQEKEAMTEWYTRQCRTVTKCSPDKVEVLPLSYPHAAKESSQRAPSQDTGCSGGLQIIEDTECKEVLACIPSSACLDSDSATRRLLAMHASARSDACGGRGWLDDLTAHASSMGIMGEALIMAVFLLKLFNVGQSGNEDAPMAEPWAEFCTPFLDYLRKFGTLCTGLGWGCCDDCEGDLVCGTSAASSLEGAYGSNSRLMALLGPHLRLLGLGTATSKDLSNALALVGRTAWQVKGSGGAHVLVIAPYACMVPVELRGIVVDLQEVKGDGGSSLMQLKSTCKLDKGVLLSTPLDAMDNEERILELGCAWVSLEDSSQRVLAECELRPLQQCPVEESQSDDGEDNGKQLRWDLLCGTGLATCHWLRGAASTRRLQAAVALMSLSEDELVDSGAEDLLTEMDALDQAEGTLKRASASICHQLHSSTDALQNLVAHFAERVERASSKMLKKLSGNKCNAEVTRCVLDLLKEQRSELGGGKVTEDRALVEQECCDPRPRRGVCGALAYRINVKKLLNSAIRLLSSTGQEEGRGMKRRSEILGTKGKSAKSTR